MASVVNINEVPEGHVALDVQCVDRLYLNAYCPVLQVPGQVVQFLTGHLGYPIPSPALFQKIGNRFRREVDHFSAALGIPVLHLKKPDRSRWDDRKLDHVRPHLDRAAREGRFGVVAIVVAQEFQWVTGARNRSRKPGVASYEFVKEGRRVNAYYFYVHDRDFGPGFIKICSYFPYPAKVCLLTGMSGPSGRPPLPGSPSPSWPTGLPRARPRPSCKASATVLALPTSRPSSTGGPQ
jgi:hypothetical protein